jgi:PAS domain S-box-containing protein
MGIDIQTATIFSIIVNIFQSVFMLLYAGMLKHYRGIQYWAFGNIVFAAGMTLWLLRGPVPSGFSIIAGNTIVIVAGCFIYLGTSLFVKNQRSTLLIFTAPALTLLLFLYFTLYNDNIAVRTAIMSVMGGALTGATGLLIFRSSLRPMPTSYRFTGGVFAAYSLILLFQAGLVPFFSPQSFPLAPSFAQVFFFLVAPVFGLLVTVGFGLMITQRLLSELRETGTALEQEHSRTKTMLENLANGVVACDKEGRFTLFNQVARNFYDWTAANLSIDQISESHPIYLPDGQTHMKVEELPLYRAMRGEYVRDVECIFLSEQGQARHFLVNASPLINHLEQPWGGIAVFADITERKQAEQAQAKILAELQTSLKEIKTLRGLVPICAHCKNVRDDSGFWQQVEDYLHRHTEAEFSHGICPECFHKHFGDFKKSRRQ